MKWKIHRGYLLGILVLILVGGILYIPKSRSFMNSNSGAVSGVLSLLLVLLYLIQYQTQKEQQKLMEADHRSVIEVEDYWTEDEKIIFQLSNFGNGVATDIELVSLSVFEDTEYFSPGTMRNRLTRKSDDPDRNRMGQSLKPGEGRIAFEALPSIGFELNSGQIHRCGFRTGMDELHTEDVDIIRLFYYIRYGDLLGEKHIFPVFMLEAEPIEKRRKFEQVFKEAGQVPIRLQIIGEPKISADDLSFNLSDVEISDRRTVV
ncbi:hypothetical protein [Haladaptatus sp. DYF46]|uniref:hypothetical protein n=1 Tax=Haladaptatus sp. DYF46 TaxID=2886041 RepID=UPI001E3100A8|nr:hypothetical protein [Haladaptatus sp. DYF46]